MQCIDMNYELRFFISPSFFNFLRMSRVWACDFTLLFLAISYDSSIERVRVECSEAWRPGKLHMLEVCRAVAQRTENDILVRDEQMKEILTAGLPYHTPGREH
jgi:hypothetical protein